MIYKNKRILFLGDSITALGGWVKLFNGIFEPEFFANLAVGGASWRDYPDTVYDGNPVLNGTDNNINNTISNQLVKLTNLRSENDDYRNFDIIIVSAGTNDRDVEGLFEDNNKLIESQFEKPDELNRQIWPGVMRATYETLRNYYPTADIFYCAPIQGAEEIRPYNVIKAKGDFIEKICRRISDVHFINTANCGICGAFEKPWENGRDLYDGLHPNSNGEIKIAKYNAREIEKILSTK